MVPDSPEATQLGATYASGYDRHGERRHFQIPTAGAHSVLVQLSPGVADSTSRCTGCGHTDHDFSELEILARAGAHASACGRGTVTAALDAETATVRGELTRVDPKAASYRQDASVVLAGGLAVLAGTGAAGALPLPALIAGSATAAVILAAVATLMLATRPRLDGDVGFMAHADVASPDDVLAAVARAGVDQTLPPAAQARELWWLSRIVRDKYQAIRLAVPLLLTGYAGAAITTAIAIWGR
jgi:hypothetical protein